MSVLAVTFAIVWASVALYISWLGVQQRRLVQRLRALEQQVAPKNRSKFSSARAA